eukprot:5505794-Prymnesium_polylepis.1
MDDWGQGGVTLGAVAGLWHPFLADGTVVSSSTPVVSGMPVFYSDAELRMLLDAPRLTTLMTTGTAGLTTAPLPTSSVGWNLAMRATCGVTRLMIRSGGSLSRRIGSRSS